MKPSSQNYDGGVPPGRSSKRLTLSGREAPVFPSRGKNSSHGVGARAKRCYCECGAKKRAGICPRCEKAVG